MVPFYDQGCLLNLEKRRFSWFMLFCNPLAEGGFGRCVLLCTATLCDLSCVISVADFCKLWLQTGFSFREMATTFARLCQQVDVTQKNLEKEIARLSKEIDQLENIQSHSKQLRWVCMLLPRANSWHCWPLRWMHAVTINLKARYTQVQTPIPLSFTQNQTALCLRVK